MHFEDFIYLYGEFASETEYQAINEMHKFRSHSHQILRLCIPEDISEQILKSLLENRFEVS